MEINLGAASDRRRWLGISQWRWGAGRRGDCRWEASLLGRLAVRAVAILLIGQKKEISVMKNESGLFIFLKKLLDAKFWIAQNSSLTLGDLSLR